MARYYYLPCSLIWVRGCFLKICNWHTITVPPALVKLGSLPKLIRVTHGLFILWGVKQNQKTLFTLTEPEMTGTQNEVPNPFTMRTQQAMGVGGGRHRRSTDRGKTKKKKKVFIFQNKNLLTQKKWKIKKKTEKHSQHCKGPFICCAICFRVPFNPPLPKNLYCWLAFPWSI